MLSLAYCVNGVQVEVEGRMMSCWQINRSLEKLIVEFSGLNDRSGKVIQFRECVSLVLVHAFAIFLQITPR